jgi:DivIVA domain-containing protein
MRPDKIVSEVLGGDVPFTPADILEKRFHRALFGGYQGQEVDGFLERVADVFETLIRQNRELKEQLEGYKLKCEEHDQMQETLRNALVASQKLGESVAESARREADTIIQSARVEKERMLAQAMTLPPALAQEINQLQQERNRLRKDMTALLTTHRALLESLSTAEEAVGLGTEDTVFFGIHPDAQAQDAGQSKSSSKSFEPIADDAPDPTEESAL